jgi:hypothetical protein
MIDRRHFLIGAGTLLTASFVRRASAFSKKTGGPLISPAVQEPEETLYVYWQAENEVANWRVSLGPDQPFAPPPPTWREHLRSLGHPLETDDEIERACRKYDSRSVSPKSRESPRPNRSRRFALKLAKSPHGLPQMCWPGRGPDRAPANALSTAAPGVSANSTGAVLRSSRYCPS